MLKREDFKKIVSEIVANLSDQGKVTDLLTQLDTGFETVSTNYDSLNTKLEDNENKIKSLQESNMNLFLRAHNPVPDKLINNTEPLEYDNLIKELGGIK